MNTFGLVTTGSILDILILILSFITFVMILLIFFKVLKQNKQRTKRKTISVESISDQDININTSISTAIGKLYLLNKGATIVIENSDSIDEFISNPVLLDANINSDLIINVFEGNKSPLHDGAIIISENRIKYASAYIKVLSSKQLDDDFGTRHRSAIGLTEQTDSISIILSEETGKIIISKKGEYEFVSIDQLALRLSELKNAS